MKFDLRLFIEQIVQQELEEVAVALGAVSSNSALFIDGTSSSITRIALYDLGLAATCLRDGLSLVGAIHGYIEVMPNNHCIAKEIKASAANKGYGPLMYDIAFSLADAAGLMADRKSVKQAAKNVWKHNFTARRNDFTLFPLDGVCRSLAGQKSEDDYLNWRYVAKKPINLSAIIAAHKKFADNTYQEFNVAPHRFEEKLMLAGQEFFEDKYF